MEVPVVLVTLSASNSGTVGDDRDHEIVIRPSQYVGWDGKVQHPYLLQWGQHWDVCFTLIIEISLRIA